MKIIAFSAKKQGGKTTAVEFLAEKLRSQGKMVAIVNFADQLKDIFFRLFVPCEWQWDIEKFNENKDTLLPTINKTVREGLQWFGTDICREAYTDVWINAYKAEIHRFIHCDYILTGDVRFPNEVRVIQEIGFDNQKMQ